MCGFLVLIDDAARTSPRPDLCEVISHRGPDSVGHATVSTEQSLVELHFRRLAIIDLDHRSDQPFGDAARALLVYNGELYNAGELRRTLQARGVCFCTTGDTEVLYELLLQRDWRDLLARVDGMFAFVIAFPDGAVQYGRDRLGIKPLYEARYAAGGIAGLSSEIEPLRRAGLAGSADTTAIAAAAMFLCVPPPRTGWMNVASVQPGSVWSCPARTPRTPAVQWRAGTPAADEQESIADAVRCAVARQVHADVPVGLLLSGGLDSTWLALELARLQFDGPLLAARSGHGVRDESEPFEEDAPFAQRVAGEIGRSVTWTDLDARLLQQVPELVGAMESPFGDPAAVALMNLSKSAAAHAKVILSGVGVEEMFLGYERYQAIKMLDHAGSAAGLAAAVPHGLIPRRLRERAAKLRRVAAAPKVDWPWVSQSYFDPVTWRRLVPSIEMDDVVRRHRDVTQRSLDSGATILEATAQTDQELFLPGLNLHYADRASMHASVELRVPFLSEPVIAVALRQSAREHVAFGNGKRLFRAAAASAGVPDYVVTRRKTGFGAPIRSIMRAQGHSVMDAIKDGEVFVSLLDREEARRLFNSHVAGQEERGLALFGLTCIAVWWERNVTGGTSIADRLRHLPVSEVEAT